MYHGPDRAIYALYCVGFYRRGGPASFDFDDLYLTSIAHGRHSGVLGGRKIDEKERQEATFLPRPAILQDFCSQKSCLQE